MRTAITTLVFVTAVLAAPTHPPTEECAAMLLSPGAEWRKAGRTALAEGSGVEYREKVLEHLARWAHNRSAWIDALELELEKTDGARHVAIRRVLKILKDAGEDSIGVDVVLLDLPRAEAEAILGAELPTVIASAPKTWESWWTTLGRSNQATLLFKTSLPGKEALEVTVERKRMITYVKDFVIDGKVGSPEIAEIETGAFLKWRPIVARNREFVTLHFDLRLVEVVRPIAVKEVDLGKLKARIQVPKLIEMEKRMSITLPLGGHGAFLVGRAPGAEATHVTIALVRAATGSPRGIPDLPIKQREPGTGIRRSATPK